VAATSVCTSQDFCLIFNLIVASSRLWSFGQPHTHTHTHVRTPTQTLLVYLCVSVLCVYIGFGVKFTKLHFGTQLVVHLLRG